jgi:hypothetical protein
MVALVLAASGLAGSAFALTSPKWRGAFLAVALATFGTMLIDLNLQNLAHLATWIVEHKPLNETSHYHYFELGYAFPRTLFWIVSWAIWTMEMISMVFLCSSLHRVFLQKNAATELA